MSCLSCGSGSMGDYIDAGKTYILGTIEAVKVTRSDPLLMQPFIVCGTSFWRLTVCLMLHFILLIQTALEKQWKKSATFRVAFIGYRDFGDVGHLNVTPFTSDIDICGAAVEREEPDGGGDFPEDVAGGLMMASSLPWGERSANFLVLICDAPCHNVPGKVFHSSYDSWPGPETDATKTRFDGGFPAGCTPVPRKDPDDALVYLRDMHKVIILPLTARMPSASKH
jgi:hypothetical protein